MAKHSDTPFCTLPYHTAHAHTWLGPPDLGEYGEVELASGRQGLLAQEQGGGGGGEGVLAVQLSSQVVPVLQANLENLLLIYF